MGDTDILDEIMGAWRKDTDWEQFGRDVGDVLVAHGLISGKPPSEKPDVWHPEIPDGATLCFTSTSGYTITGRLRRRRRGTYLHTRTSIIGVAYLEHGDYTLTQWTHRLT